MVFCVKKEVLDKISIVQINGKPIPAGRIVSFGWNGRKPKELGYAIYHLIRTEEYNIQCGRIRIEGFEDIPQILDYITQKLGSINVLVHCDELSEYFATYFKKVFSRTISQSFLSIDNYLSDFSEYFIFERDTPLNIEYAGGALINFLNDFDLFTIGRKIFYIKNHPYFRPVSNFLEVLPPFKTDCFIDLPKTISAECYKTPIGPVTVTYEEKNEYIYTLRLRD